MNNNTYVAVSEVLVEIVDLPVRTVPFIDIPKTKFLNFEWRKIEILDENIDFGTKNICKIKRNGDLLGRVYLKMKFPEISEDDIETTDDKTELYIRWSESPGYSIIDNISIKIGGQEIDKQDGIYMQIWSDITDDQEVKSCLLGNKTF